MFKSMCIYRKLYIALLADTPGWSSLYSHYHFAWTMIFGGVGLAYIPWPRCRRPCCEYKNESVSSFMGRLALPAVPSAHPYLPPTSWATVVGKGDFDLTLPLPDDWPWWATVMKNHDALRIGIACETSIQTYPNWACKKSCSFMSENLTFAWGSFITGSLTDRGRDLWDVKLLWYFWFAYLEFQQFHCMCIN